MAHAGGRLRSCPGPGDARGAVTRRGWSPALRSAAQDRAHGRVPRPGARPRAARRGRRAGTVVPTDGAGRDAVRSGNGGLGAGLGCRRAGGARGRGDGDAALRDRHRRAADGFVQAVLPASWRPWWLV